MNDKRILLLSTGGTITMTSQSGKGITPTLSGEDLVRAVPELSDKADLDVRSVSFKPGASLTLENLVEIATLLNHELAGEIDGAVVVQGTDTIEETAFVLDLLVDSDKPVIVTGAMRGPVAPGADGPANLLAATTVATALNARGMGTLVVLNDEVHAARYVQKSHTALPSAFTSPLLGPVGRVIEGAFKRYAVVPRSRHLSLPTQSTELSVEFLPPVALIKVVLGDDGRLLPALSSLGYRGAVIEGMGAGHLPASLAPMLATLAEKMPTVLATRVTTGPTFSRTYQFPGSEMDLLARGAIRGCCLSGVKACLLLRLLLSCQLTAQELIAEYQLRSNLDIQ
ncbi:asparaginase [Serratia fonticola]|uniref:Asparaginase n=1 Tax=Serratia fonticola TaxID=47917 RepID=A0AAJ2DBN1_SERFO|nr:asparaginase [Serratia fonticola]MDQ9129668.1 asparaginase [Serratia fonticola]